MIPRELYPTPADVALKMTSLVDFEKVESILEPSAGNGDLAAAAIRSYEIHNYRGFAEKERDPFLSDVVDLVEIDETCRAYLKSKNANVMQKGTIVIYELINPSDPYTFVADDLETAALGVFMIKCECRKRTGADTEASARRFWDKLNRKEQV